CGNQTMLYTPVPAQRFLISTGMEKSYILRFAFSDFWQINIEMMGLRIVVIHAVAGEASEGYIMILLIPVVYRQHNIFLVQAPTVRQLGYKGAVYHIPELLFILKFFSQYGIQNGATFTHGVAPKLGENIRL